MKLNNTPRHYMPLSQSQSDDDESGPSTEERMSSFKDSLTVTNKLNQDEGHAKLSDVDPKSLPMSPARRLFFIFSLILCFLFVVIFVFLAPCSNTSSLHHMCHLTNRWKSVHQNMSYISPLDFVHSENLDSYIVILGYANDESGLIAIEGPTGKECWRLTLHSTPTSSLCNAIDVNSDGSPECIVIGNNGLLTAVDPGKGACLWYLHDHNDLRTVTYLDQPMLMPDCDSDNIPDLFVPYINKGDNVIQLALVSGGTGQIVGSLLELKQCKGPVSAHFMWKMQNETDFILSCGGNLWFLSSKSVCDAALNISNALVLENVFSIPDYAVETHLYKISASNKHLVLVLNGNEIMLIEESDFTFEVVWQKYFENHHIRVLTDGQFSNGSEQLVILSNYLSLAKVIGLNLKNGNEVWSIIQDKGNVTSALKLPKFFANTDGLILKVVSSSASFSSESEMKDEKQNTSRIIQEKVSRNKSNGNMIQLKENYVLVKPETIPVITVLNTEDIWSLCEDNVCKPDVYTPNATVLISASKLGISVDMLAVSSTLSPSNNSVPLKEVFIKFWNLQNVCYVQGCSL